MVAAQAGDRAAYETLVAIERKVQRLLKSGS